MKVHVYGMNALLAKLSKVRTRKPDALEVAFTHDRIPALTALPDASHGAILRILRPFNTVST